MSSLADSVDDRTVRQQLEDLDLKIIRQKKQVTGVTWARKGAHRIGTMVRPPHMRIADRCITFNPLRGSCLKTLSLNLLSVWAHTRAKRSSCLRKIRTATESRQAERGMAGFTVARPVLGVF